jgi:hypothetical protein
MLQTYPNQHSPTSGEFQDRLLHVSRLRQSRIPLDRALTAASTPRTASNRDAAGW